MSRLFTNGMAALIALSLITLPGRGNAQEQSGVFATLQVAGISPGYLSDNRVPGGESQSGFFPVTGETIRVESTSYLMQANSGPVKSGSTVTLKSNGRFLSCCTAGKAADGPTVAGNKEWFTVTLYTADQRSQILAKRAAAKDRKAPPRMDSHVD
jgi:hypothetical protein